MGGIMEKAKMIAVFPNPWMFIDHNGIPSGVVPKEPVSDTDNPREFVGAKIDRDKTRVTNKADAGELRNSRQSTRFLFRGIPADELTPSKLVAAGPVSVTDSPYYRKAIRRGELVAAEGALDVLSAWGGAADETAVASEQLEQEAAPEQKTTGADTAPQSKKPRNKKQGAD